MAPRRQIKQPAATDGKPRQGRSRQVKASKRENEVAASDELTNPPKKSRGRQKNVATSPVAGTTAKNKDARSKSKNQAEKEPEDVVVISSASENEIIEKKTRGRKNAEKAGNKVAKDNTPVARKPKITMVENYDRDPGESTVGEGSTKRSTRRTKKTVDESDATTQPISVKAVSKKRKNTNAQVDKENEREKARERRSRAQGWIWLSEDLPAEERRRIMIMHAPITKKKQKKGKTVKLWLPKDLPAKEKRKIAMTHMNS
ncbi:uncharacterized protein LOC105830363 [Monomorium pharaonis]|uniref:uncharacterized protein LOC105830363 n=1 Tax=Monomorium pharaonis TaxID=307658 RepID=UPI00063F0AD7|nr:uncharacterized protein LOC105830363 [Monomorium pharaonis]XP_028045085.1 uncharacterized protein LOC105830363 [Monomorium pharaonis]